MAVNELSKATGRRKTAVGKNCTQHGLKKIAQHGIPLAAALPLLAPAQQQPFVQPLLPGPLRQTLRTYQLGTQAGQLALARAGNGGKELLRNAQLQHGIAQKLQPFVMFLPRAVLIGPRTVRQRQTQKIGPGKIMPQRACFPSRRVKAGSSGSCRHTCFPVHGHSLAALLPEASEKALTGRGPVSTS